MSDAGEFRDAGEFWQAFTEPPDPPPTRWQGRYAARMRDGSALVLPLRDYGSIPGCACVLPGAAYCWWTM